MGWIWDDGNSYYLRSTGELATSTTVDGYKVDEIGAWVQ